MRSTAVAFAFCAVVALTTARVASATDGSIGIFSDPAGTQTHASFVQGQPTTLYVIARLSGATADGASGFEYRITNFPADWFAALTPNPFATLILGDPLHVAAGVHRVNMVFSGCQQPPGTLLLYTIFCVPTSGATALHLTVDAGSPPSNPSYTTPIILRCNYPDFTPVAAEGGTFTIDNVRTPVGLDYSLQAGYDGMRGVQPIMALPGEAVRFRANYSQIAGEPLPSGQPLLQIDGNNDGDSNDAGEGTYVMVPADHDSTTTDGKEYLLDVALAAAPTGRWRYRCSAVDAHGQSASGLATVWNDSLFVSNDLVDLVVRAEDITVGASPTNPADPRPIVVRFSNASNVAVHDILVRVEEPNGAMLIERTFSSLAPQATGMLSFEHNFINAGAHIVTVRIDAANAVGERDETNNVASHAVNVVNFGAAQLQLQLLPVSFQDPPLQPFRVTGSARYISTILGGTPASSGARVTWAPSWEASSESRSDESGAFASSFIAPAAPGFYSVVVTVRDGAMVGVANVPVQVLGSITQHGPDLVPELALAPVSPCPGSGLVAQWSVRNSGDVASAATTVRLELDGPQIAVERSIGALAPGATTVLPDAALGTATAGPHWVTARVDPTNLVRELHEENNARVRRAVVPGAFADLGVDSLRFAVPPCAGPATAISVYVGNHGCATSTATRVALRDGGVEGASLPLAALAPGANTLLAFSYAIPTAGCHSFVWVVDPDAVPGANGDPAGDALPAEVCLRTCALPSDAVLNYQVPQCDLASTNVRPRAGQSTQFTARILNAGTTSAIAPVTVRFTLDGSTWVSDVLVGPVLAGQIVQVVSAAWPVDFTPRQLHVTVDPANLQPETNEFDNEGSAGLPYEIEFYALPTCPPGNPSTFSACSPCVNQPVGIRAMLRNNGLFEADSVTVQFSDVGQQQPILGSVVATSVNILNRCGSSTGNVPVEFVQAFQTEGAHQIQIDLDPENRWPEGFENLYNRTVTQLSVLCTDRPDLAVSFAWPPGLVVGAGETVTSTPLIVRNLGSAGAINAHVRVRLEGNDLCADLVIPSIAAFSTANLSCDQPWIVSSADCQHVQVLEACVDPGNTIAESNEANNCASSLAPTGTSDVHPFSLAMSVAHPANGQAINVNLQVRNLLSGVATGGILLYTYPNIQLIGATGFTANPFGLASIPWTYDSTVDFLLVQLTGICPRDINTSNDAAIFSTGGSPPGVPVAVTDLEAVSREAGVQLRWSAQAEITAFQVERRDTGADAWKRLAVVPRHSSASGTSWAWDVLDAEAPPGARLEYRLLALPAGGGEFEVVGTLQVEHTQARVVPWLESARPHPFRPGGVLAFTLPKAAEARVAIYDAAGRHVADPWQGMRGAGRHEIVWDAKSDGGRVLPAGVYFVELRAAGVTRIQRLVLVH